MSFKNTCSRPRSSIKRKLPPEVKRRIAGMSVVGKDVMKQTLLVADAVHATLTDGAVSAASLDFDTSADAPALQVAAFKPQRRKQNQTSASRGARSGPSTGRQTGQQAPADRGNPHPDGPPASACNLHWKYGKSAFRCRKLETCPWAHYVPAKQNNQ